MALFDNIKRFLRTPASGVNAGKQAIEDANLAVADALNIPHSDDNTLNGAQVKDGYVKLSRNLDGDLVLNSYADGKWTEYVAVLDGLKSIGGITLIDNEVTVIAPVKWRIGGVNYEKLVDTVFTIPSATSGYNRIDLIYANNNNEILKIQGVETTGVAVEPNLPSNSVRIAPVFISGNVIQQPIPDLSIYITKSEAEGLFLKINPVDPQTAFPKVYGSIGFGLESSNLATIGGDGNQMRISKQGASTSNIDFIGTAGQTIFHIGDDNTGDTPTFFLKVKGASLFPVTDPKDYVQAGYVNNLFKPESTRLDLDYTDIDCNGDSLTEGVPGQIPYPTELINLTGFNIVNKGVGGETSTQIKDRFIADTADYYKSHIIWAGRNNLLDPTTVRSDINAMVSAMGHTRYLVLSILNGADEPKDSPIYDAIIALNNGIKSDHPNNYIDIRSDLVNLFPNPQDIIDPSLRVDALHLNTLGNQKVAEFLNGSLGILFNQNYFLQSKDFKYYLGAYNTISGTGAANQLAYFTGENTEAGAIGLIYDEVSYSLGVGTSPITAGSAGTSWVATGAPISSEYSGGLIASIAGINQAYFYASQLYAIVRGGINYLEDPIGVKLIVNDDIEALIAEPDGNILIGTDVNDGVNKVQVNGDIKISGNSGGVGLKINNANNIGYSEIRFDNDTPNSGGSFVFSYGGTGTGNIAYFFQRRNAAIVFGTNNIERFSIQGSGEVKINNLSGTGTRPVAAQADGTLAIDTGGARLSGGNVFTGDQTINNGNLLLIGTGNYRVGNDRFAFISDSFPNAGLYFNATNGRYDFRATDSSVTGSISALNGGTVSSPNKPLLANDMVRLTDLGTGWAVYTDTVYTSGSPFTITSGSTSTLPNNAGTVINTQIPLGVTSFYNSGTSKITPQNDGDYYVSTIRFKAKTTAPTAGYLDFGIDIGGALGIQFKETKIFAKGAGIEHNYSIVVPMFTAATFLANGGLVKLTAGNGDMTIYDISYQIDRTHKAK